MIFVGADVENGIRPDLDTVYLIASCTKAFTTAGIGILASEGKLSWAEPVQTYVPEFSTKQDPEIGKRATLTDICSHGTGLAPVDHVVCGFYDEFFNDNKDEVAIAASLPVAYDFRSRFLYNNTLLGVAGDIIARVSGGSSGTFLRKRIFEPLGLSRTCTTNKEMPTDGNVATGYSVLDDGSLFRWRRPALEDGKPQGGAGYVRSTVRDMLAWAKAIMEAEGDWTTEMNVSTDHNQVQETSNTLQQIPFVRTSRRPIIDERSPLENAYALGWFRHMLPSAWLGSISPNFGLFADPPLINSTGCPRLTIAHWGEFNGFLTAFYTFPNSNSAVVVMANCSPARGDPTDLIAQHLVQNLFDMRPRIDLETAANQAASAARLMWPALIEEFVTKKVQNTEHRPLNSYTGVYESIDFRLSIRVYRLSDEEMGKGPNPELLGFQVNSLADQCAKLRHYHYDTWTFIPDSRDDAVKKGMEGFLQLSLLIMTFVANEQNEINALEWDLQGGKCEGPAPGLGAAVPAIRFERTAKLPAPSSNS